MAYLPAVPVNNPPIADGLLAYEQVPQLFRAILDLVADLERQGGRRQAERLRRDAITAYSAGWDEAGRRRLQGIVVTLERRLSHPGIRGRFHIG